METLSSRATLVSEGPSQWRWRPQGPGGTLSPKTTSLERSGHQGALKEPQSLALRLKLHLPKPGPRRALQEVSSEVLTRKERPLGSVGRFLRSPRVHTTGEGQSEDLLKMLAA